MDGRWFRSQVVLREVTAVRWCALALVTALCLGLSACAPPEDAEDAGVSEETSETDLDAPLLEPFDSPSLAELEASVEWIDQPVEDGIDNLRARQADEELLATVPVAQALRNTSPENNAKIRSAMGRLPESDANVDYDATLNRHFNADINTTCAIQVSSRYDMELSGLIGTGLFAFDWNFRSYANSHTVVSWQTSKDRMYDKVVMRNDLTWSDGQPFTAHDVAFSFKTIMNPRVPVPAVRSGTTEIRWVEAYNDQTLVYFHKHPLATNVWNVNFPILAKHVYEKSVEDDPTLQTSDYHVALQGKPVTNGQYELVSRTTGQELLLRRRESWYMHNGKQVRPKPHFKEIRCRIISDTNSTLLALKKGEIDEAELSAEQWKTQTASEDFYERNTKAYGLEWSFSFIGWNMQTEYFQDVRVRKAMSYALDYDEMLDNICYGLYEPCGGVYHPTAWMASKNTQPYKQDLDKSEELLAKAGWEDHDGDGILDKEIQGKLVPFEFSLLVPSGSTTGLRIATLFKENLDSIGVLCNIRQIEFATLLTRIREHQFHAMAMGFGTGADPDTSENIWSTKAITQGRNYSGFSDARVDELFELGKREFDREKRAIIYAEVQERVYDAQPFTFLYFRSSFFGFNKRIRGYNFSPRGPDGYDPGYGALWVTAP